MPKVSNERKTLLGSLDALVEKYHLLKHPFYRAWTEGKLSKKALALYAEQYYQHVQAFPENLRDLASRSNGERGWRARRKARVNPSANNRSITSTAAAPPRNSAAKRGEGAKSSISAAITKAAAPAAIQ